MRLSRITYILSTFLFILGSCKNDGLGSGANQFLGGDKVIRIAEVITPVSIFPQRITNVVEGLIASQIHEGLIKINPTDLSIMPGLAEKWEINPDGKSITFYLRKGLKFHDINGVASDITTKDVKFTFELLCTDRPGNVHFETVCKDRILGANKFYQANIKGLKAQLKGLKIINELTFTIELLNSPNIFLEILANPVASIISEEAYKLKKEDTKIGAGPFVLDEKTSTKTHYALYKNMNYYAKDKDGKSLPYIDSLIIDIVSSTEIALQRFQHGNTDFIGSLPSNQVRQAVEENIKSFKSSPPVFILDQRPEMGTSYYVFNVNHPPFNNIKLRQALNYGIDRLKIIDRVLNGQAYGPAINGIVPPTFDFYKSYNIKGYDFDLEKAKKLLAEAGYPNGKGLKEVQLIVNSGNSRNNTVAVEIQKQLKNNLNININFESLPNPEKFELQIKGRGDMFRDGWVADYPSPESFLSIFYGEPVTDDTTRMSYPNTIKYKNSEYDKYYKLGRDALNRDTAAVNFLKAEQILMNDAPLMVLWYESNCRLIKTRLKNFHVNPIRYFDFTQVIIEDKK